MEEINAKYTVAIITTKTALTTCIYVIYFYLTLACFYAYKMKNFLPINSDLFNIP